MALAAPAAAARRPRASASGVPPGRGCCPLPRLGMRSVCACGFALDGGARLTPTVLAVGSMSSRETGIRPPSRRALSLSAWLLLRCAPEAAPDRPPPLQRPETHCLRDRSEEWGPEAACRSRGQATCCLAKHHSSREVQYRPHSNCSISRSCCGAVIALASAFSTAAAERGSWGQCAGRQGAGTTSGSLLRPRLRE